MHFSDPHAKFGENRQIITHVIVRQPICPQTHGHTEGKPIKESYPMHWIDNKSSPKVIWKERVALA